MTSRGRALGVFSASRQYRGTLLRSGILILLLAFGACSVVPPNRKPKARNLILIVMDTLRADHVSAYGSHQAQTPHIDQLAEQGILFTRAYSHIPVTGPSHSSMFTGLLPIQHGVEKNTDILPASFETIAESLKKIGYSTYGVISLGVLKGRFGFSQGFDVFEDTFDRQWFLRAEEVVRKIGKMLPEKAPDSGIFLFAHFSDPHEPYSPPGLDYPEFSILSDGKLLGTCRADGMGCEVSFDLKTGPMVISIASAAEVDRELGFRQLEVHPNQVTITLAEGWGRGQGSPPGRMNRCRLPAKLVVTGEAGTQARLSFFASEILDLEESRQRYAGEVEYADAQIGRLLKMLRDRGYLENSLIVFTADHGEGLGQHGLLGHKKQVYDSLIRVPLLMVAKGMIPPGLRCDDAISHIDMNASIRKAMGLGPAPMSPGIPVLQDFLVGSEIPQRPQVSMTFASSGEVDLRAAVLERFKLIRNLDSGREEFYDLGRDPEELNDLFRGGRVGSLSSSQEQILRRLGAALDSVAEMENSGRFHTADTLSLSPEDRARLEALGYTQ